MLTDWSDGENKEVLPVPAVFMVGKNGKVQYTHYDPNYKKRLEPKELIATAKKMKREGS